MLLLTSCSALPPIGDTYVFHKIPITEFKEDSSFPRQLYIPKDLRHSKVYKALSQKLSYLKDRDGERYFTLVENATMTRLEWQIAEPKVQLTKWQKEVGSEYLYTWKDKKKIKEDDSLGKILAKEFYNENIADREEIKQYSYCSKANLKVSIDFMVAGESYPTDSHGAKEACFSSPNHLVSYNKSDLQYLATEKAVSAFVERIQPKYHYRSFHFVMDSTIHNEHLKQPSARLTREYVIHKGAQLLEVDWQQACSLFSQFYNDNSDSFAADEVLFNYATCEMINGNWGHALDVFNTIARHPFSNELNPFLKNNIKKLTPLVTKKAS